MQYSEICIQVASGDLETASAIANLAVPYGIYIEDYSDIEEMAPQIAHVDLIEQELLDRDRTQAKIHLYISPEESPAEATAFLQARLTAAGVAFSMTDSKIDEEEWATAWKKYYFPTKLGERLVVVPSWEQYDKAPGDVVLTLDPGMAFGTGTHDTTRLCAGLLEQYVQPDMHMLDIGTGSGILAICAALLGAKSVQGVDIDEVAVRVAQENAELNRVQDQCSFCAGDLTDKISGTFELVTANIVADVIIRLVPVLEQFLKPNGVFIASGIIDLREKEVVDTLEAAGWRLCERMTSGGWVALAACRAAERN